MKSFFSHSLDSFIFVGFLGDLYALSISDVDLEKCFKCSKDQLEDKFKGNLTIPEASVLTGKKVSAVSIKDMYTMCNEDVYKCSKMIERRKKEAYFESVDIEGPLH